MQEGLTIKEGLLVLLTAAVDSEMIDLLAIVIGMEAPDARKAVSIWKTTSLHIVFNILASMIFCA